MINLKTKSKENKKCVFALKEPSGVMTIVITPPAYREGTWDIGCCATTTRKIGLAPRNCYRVGQQNGPDI